MTESGVSKDIKNNRPISVGELAQAIVMRLGSSRLIIAIAGPPGTGKTTTTNLLQARLEQAHGLKVQVVPMDGFHFDNSILDQIGLRHRKGAPETFDVEGLASLLQRLSLNASQDGIVVPVFDREIDLARASARLVPQETQVVLVEGNYLLLKTKPWADLIQYFDQTVMIDSPLDVLHARLMKRWLDHGFSPEEAATRVEENDLMNARLIARNSRCADFSLCSDKA